MRVKNLVLTAGALVLGFAAFTAVTAVAQGPLYDRVIVNLPYTVTIGDRTLAPGEYVIQQNRSEGGGQRVLLIYSDQGMKFETSAMTIPTLDNRTPEDTKVVLHHYGPDYYFDKIWIQGKNYGYEFPLPDSVKARQRERSDHHHRVGERDFVLQAAHLANVLLVMHRDNHGAGAEEQERLEEGVREQVEHPDRIGADTHRHEHVAELRTGRIGNDALDVVLHEPDGRGKERGGGAEEHDDSLRIGRELEQRR